MGVRKSEIEVKGGESSGWVREELMGLSEVPFCREILKISLLQTENVLQVIFIIIKHTLFALFHYLFVQCFVETPFFFNITFSVFNCNGILIMH